jgi:hypothetical protein
MLFLNLGEEIRVNASEPYFNFMGRTQVPNQKEKKRTKEEAKIKAEGISSS